MTVKREAAMRPTRVSIAVPYAEPLTAHASGEVRQLVQDGLQAWRGGDAVMLRSVRLSPGRQIAGASRTRLSLGIDAAANSIILGDSTLRLTGRNGAGRLSAKVIG